MRKKKNHRFGSIVFRHLILYIIVFLNFRIRPIMYGEPRRPRGTPPGRLLNQVNKNLNIDNKTKGCNES